MEPSFLGDGRFEVLRRLGQGAMGVVYEAIDRNTAERVALKTVRYQSAADLLRLKTEFRSLADLSHPHLVQLHELFHEEERWFFSMDLLQGEPFSQWVRGQEDEMLSGPEPTWSPDDLDDAAPTPLRSVQALDDAGLQRLRMALPGLAAGVLCLHAAGKLHRDIKPSNTMVRADGHTVLLDFGLVSSAQKVGSPTAAGTVPYMSPEVVAGGSATEASDWYAVGVVLFSCLTGRLPFQGAASHVLRDKQERDPPPVRTLAPETPEDLASLTDALLRRDPKQRLDGAGVSERLGLEAPVRDVPFVGRAAELALLRDALSATGQRIVTVTARSGVGKTALLDAVLADEDGVVLRSRCYEREAAPYKALDPLIDVLSVYLEGLPGAERAELMPPQAGSLGRLFPVLTRLGGAFRQPPPSEGLELRAQAEEALSWLLERVARLGRLVVVVDDLQWGDLDSVAVLAAALRHGVPALWVFAWRSDDPAVVPLLGALPVEDAVHIELAPLAETEALQLALEVIPDHSAATRLAKDTSGHPFLLVELARWVAEHGETPPDLESVLDARVAELPTEVRALLVTVAVAGHPLETSVAIHAARRLEPGAGASALALLRARRLLASHRGQLTCAHDRIRERVRDSLQREARVGVHRALAESLPADAVLQLAEHWHEAGAPERAAPAALAAARQAHGALAFDQAARLYERWLSGVPASHPERERVSTLRAEALGQAGRHREAGESWLLLGEGRGTTALTRRRLGVSHLMVAGELDAAYEELPQLLAALNLRMPAQGWLGYLELVWFNVKLRLFGPPRARPVDAQHLLRTDLLLALSESLVLTDPLRGLQLQGRAIDAAYKSGDPRRLVPVLALRAVSEFALGRGATARDLLDEADAKAQDEEGRDAVRLWRAAIATYDARYADALELLDRPRPHTHGSDSNHPVIWRTFRLLCLSQLGRFQEFADEVAESAADARARGQRIAEMMYRTGFPVSVELARDQPEKALEELARAADAWPASEGSVPWVFQQCSWVQIDLYLGRVEDALARVDRVAPIASANGALIGPAQHAWWHAVAGTAALHGLAAGGDRAMAKRAWRHIRPLVRRRELVNRVTGLTHQASLEAFLGQPDRALATLTRCEALVGQAQHGWWPLYMQGMRARLTEDAALREQAWSGLRKNGVLAPQRFERVFWLLPERSSGSR